MVYACREIVPNQGRANMFRTFLVANSIQAAPPQFDGVIQRVAELYGSRVIRATVRSPEQLPNVPAAETTSPDESNPDGKPSRAKSVILAGDFLESVCDKGHEADAIVVWHDNLLGADGKASTEMIADLVRQAPRPIWLAREPIRFPEHIVVAYDGSAHSGRALHMGANLAETLGAKLTVLNVDESHDDVAQELILSRAAGYCEAYRITMERVGVFGTAAVAIRSFAESSHCDLLVLGAAGVGYLRGLLFGSVTGQIISSAPCSVLIAK